MTPGTRSHLVDRIASDIVNDGDENRAANRATAYARDFKWDKEELLREARKKAAGMVRR